MILTVIKRHEVFRKWPKLLLISLVLANFAFIIAADQEGAQLQGEVLQGWPMVVLNIMAFLSAVRVLILPEAGRRCRTWELALPVSGKFWWWTHYFSLLLAGVSQILVFGLIPFFFYWLSQGGFPFSGMVSDYGRLTWQLLAMPLLAYITVLNIYTNRHHGAAHPGQEKKWRAPVGVLLPPALALLVLGNQFNLIPFLLALVLITATKMLRMKIPPCLYPAQNKIQATDSAPLRETKGAFKSGSFQVHLTIMRLLFKWPANWVLLLPFMALFGAALGGLNPRGGPDQLRFSVFFITIYVLCAGAGNFTERLDRLDFLPIRRSTLLNWLVIPSLLFLTLGYGIGQWVLQNPRSPWEAISFCNDPSSYGLTPPAIHFLPSTEDALPTIEAPWDETQTPEATIIVPGHSWVIYNPFSTPPGSSRQFVAWQISRAIVEVYGQEVPPEEIDARYLEVNSEGLVQVTGGKLTLQQDNLQWKTLSSGPVFPVIVGAVVLGYFLVLFWIFHNQRHQISTRRHRFIFWTPMSILLLLHISTLSTFQEMFVREWVVHGLVLGSVQRWYAGDWSHTLLAYGVFLVGLGIGYSVILRKFRMVEAVGNGKH